jgi:hypothetical protein
MGYRKCAGAFLAAISSGFGTAIEARKHWQGKTLDDSSRNCNGFAVGMTRAAL